MTSILEPTAGSVLRRALTVPFTDVEWRESGNGSDFTVQGHAAVFNSLSDDLGGFRELIEPGAFRAALRKQPDVRLLHNHDPNYVMARTASGTLELREDATGLHVWAKVAPLTWVMDLRESMQRGDIDQMSFAFTLSEGGDDWAVTEDGQIVRTIRADGVDELYDVSIVTYPAYRATDVSMRSVLVEAARNGRLPEETAGAIIAAAPEEPVDGNQSESRSDAGDDGAHAVNPRVLAAKARGVAAKS